MEGRNSESDLDQIEAKIHKYESFIDDKLKPDL